MVGTLLTPYEFSKVVYESGHKGLIDVYPDLLFSTEQQKKLVQFVLDSGEIRQVVKIDKQFRAVEGRYEPNQRVDGDAIVTLPKGDYPIEGAVLVGNYSVHYVYDADGTIFTIVNEKMKMYRCPDEGFMDAYLPGDIKVTKYKLTDVMLYGPDVTRYLSGGGKLASSDKYRSSLLNFDVKDRKATAEDLLKVTGTENLEDAIDVATFKAQQLEVEDLILDLWPEMVVFRNTLRQLEDGSLKLKNITHAEKYFQSEHRFNTRQANVFAQQLFKYISD